MQNIDINQRIHEAYLQCRETFAPEMVFLNDKINIRDEEEKLFYRMLKDFFIQQRQKEIIDKSNEQST